MKKAQDGLETFMDTKFEQKNKEIKARQEEEEYQHFIKMSNDIAIENAFNNVDINLLEPTIQELPSVQYSPTMEP